MDNNFAPIKKRKDNFGRSLSSILNSLDKPERKKRKKKEVKSEKPRKLVVVPLGSAK